MTKNSMVHRHPLLVTGGVAFLALAAYALYMAMIAGEFRSIDPHFNGACRLVSDIPGPEDIALLPDGSGVLISSFNRRAQLAGDPARGAIYYYSLTAPSAQPVNLLPNAPANFHPHGIGLYEANSAAGIGATLFVVNHPGADLHGNLPGDGPAHTIEVYDVVTGPTLVHRKTIADDARLITPNDVAPVSPDAFYVTNDHGSADKLMRKVEDYLQMSGSHILFYDDAAFTKLEGTYGYANGIAVSNDGDRVYLAAPSDRAVYVFERNVETNELTKQAEIDLGTGPDNISIDQAGDLWIGAHPKLLTLSMHLRDGEGLSPSQVLRVRIDKQGEAQVEEVFLSKGDDLAASTVAVRHGNRLLVGAVFGPGFLDCEMAGR